MSDAISPGATAQAAGMEVYEPARMGPIKRYVMVLFSPGAVFEDVRRNPSGWWAPILLTTLALTLFSSVYTSKYDLGLVMRAQLKDHWSMKLVQATQGPEARDKALEQTVKRTTAIPIWQIQATQWVNFLIIFTLIVWFFTFLYGLIAMLMGWLPPGAKTSRLWINLGLVAVTGIVFIAITAGINIGAMRGRGPEAVGEAPPGWTVAAGVICALLFVGLCFWLLSILAREPVFAKILSVVSLSLAPIAVFSLIGLIIVMLKTPDATPMEELVPANLTLLLGLKASGGALAALGSWIGLFNIWSLILSIVGLSKVLGRSTGEAAGAVLVPWALWVLVMVAFAAILG